MLHFLTGSELNLHPKLRHTMFTDRKTQFVDRQGWPLRVTSEGYEIDEYDRPDTLYIVCSTRAGEHVGSIRLLPTSTPHMIKDHFADIIPGIAICSRTIWECTRFCVAPNGGTKVATSLLAGSAKFMRENNVTAFLGIFDRRIERIYSRIGSVPFVLGSKGASRDIIKVGMWQFEPVKYEKLVRASLYTESEYDEMYKNSLAPVSIQYVETEIAA